MAGEKESIAIVAANDMVPSENENHSFILFSLDLPLARGGLFAFEPLFR
jgi:hypothetical protein